jgi:hypothetical protein
MTKIVHTTEPREISEIVDLIHDCWLDAEAISFNSETSVVQLRYFKEVKKPWSLINRIRFPAFECFLRISEVESLVVEDLQKIRFYDMNELKYDSKSMYVELTTGVPIGIRAKVRNFDIAVEETDNVVQKT